MPSPARHENVNVVVTLAATVLVVAILYFAQEVLIPIALSVLLAFVLTPLVAQLERWKLGRIPSVLIAGAIAFSVLFGVGWLVAGQLFELARDVPKYQDALAARIRSLGSVPVGGGVISGLTDTFRQLADEFSRVGSGGVLPSTPLGQPSPAAPVQVQIVESAPLALRLLRDWIGPVLAPFGTAGLVIIFVIFMLLGREDLRNRLIRLAGTRRVYVTTQALDEAGGRISRYLLMQLIINATYGLAVALGLWALGVPSPFLWGLLATVLRFVPYVGPWIAAALPILLSLAASEGWTMPLLTVGLFLVLELLSNNVMEPWLYGASTGVSTVGIIISAVFWTWLWGPLGLVLSTPLTVCLTVLGRHVPSAGFLNTLLSDEPPLELNVRFYQRLLALDYNEASELTAQFLKTGSLDELYDQMLLPALSLVERDRHAGLLSDDQVDFIYRSVNDLQEELKAQFDTAHASETVPAGAAEEVTRQQADAESQVRRALRVTCVPAEDEADRMAGEILAQLLVARGHEVTAIAVRAGEAATIDLLARETPDWVVISGLAPGGPVQVRRATRLLRARVRDVKILGGLWNVGGKIDQLRERTRAAGADAVAVTLHEALELLQDAAAPVGQAAQEEQQEASARSDEPARLHADPSGSIRRSA